MTALVRTQPAWTGWVTGAGRFLAFVSGLAMLLMMLAGSIDIFGTNVLGRPLPATFEFMATMMVVVIFFALALAQARKAHIRVGIVHDRLPRAVQRFLDMLQFALSAIFFGLIAYYGWKSAFQGFSVGEYAAGIVNFPIWPARFAMAVGASLMTLQCLLDLLGTVMGWSTNDASDFKLGEGI